MKCALRFTVPREAMSFDVVERISIEMRDGITGGTIADPHWSEGAEWSVREGEGVELDPRQREAAAILLMAVDLPQEMGAFATTMLEAATIGPKPMTIPPFVNHNRMTLLRHARDLVNEMIDDMTAEGLGHGDPVDP